MSKSSLVLLITCLFSLEQALAQVNRYVVFLSDKTNTPYSIDQPNDFLSERSIARRINQGITLTEQDLPVDPLYIETVSDLGADCYYSSKWMNALLVQMDQSLLTDIRSLPFVDSIHYVARGEKLTRSRSNYAIASEFQPPGNVTSDSRFQLGMLNIDDMHKQGYFGENKRIAVLDAGFIGVDTYVPFESLHQENRFIGGEDLVTYSGDPFRYSGHGTAVLSTIIADHVNYIGAAPKAEVLLYVTEDVRSEYRIEEYNWLIAAEKADSAGVDIIHSSVGYSTFNDGTMNYTFEDLDGQSAIISQAANFATERGILVVTSAGNGALSNEFPWITAPADAFDILSVGSIDESYRRSSFSSFGPTFDERIKPDVVALGTSTAIVTGAGNIITGNGTSFAAPLVAGLAAGIWQANPEWTNIQVLNAIRNSASRALEPDSLFGYGVPNFNEAVVGRVLSVEDIVADRVTVYPNPFQGNRIYIDFSHAEKLFPVHLTVYDAKGSAILERSYDAPSANGIVELQIETNSKGMYIMNIHSDALSKQVKLLKY
jgi:subtilisin family serine protease